MVNIYLASEITEIWRRGDYDKEPEYITLDEYLASIAEVTSLLQWTAKHGVCEEGCCSEFCEGKCDVIRDMSTRVDIRAILADPKKRKKMLAGAVNFLCAIGRES